MPTWGWIVAGISTLWNLVGAGACAGQLAAAPAKIEKLPPAQREAWMAMPTFARFAYVIATGAGLAGAVALLLRSAIAQPLFIVSLIGVIVQFGWFFGVYRGLSKLGASSAGFPLVIALIGVAEIWFATVAVTNGWIG